MEDAQIIIMTILRMTNHKRIGVLVEEEQNETAQGEIGFFNERGNFCLRQEDISKV